MRRLLLLLFYLGIFYLSLSAQESSDYCIYKEVDQPPLFEAYICASEADPISCSQTQFQEYVEFLIPILIGDQAIPKSKVGYYAILDESGTLRNVRLDEDHMFNGRNAIELGYEIAKSLDKWSAAIKSNSDVASALYLSLDLENKTYSYEIKTEDFGELPVRVCEKLYENAEEPSRDIPDIPRKTDLEKANTDDVFKVVEQMPTFPGCEDIREKRERESCATTKLLKFLAANINYPELAAVNKIEGNAVIKFIVNTDGYLSDFEILRDPGYGCGDEALRVCKLMNEMERPWNPGVQRGKPVRVSFNMPLRFKLQNK